jgi:hypothetical protein
MLEAKFENQVNGGETAPVRHTGPRVAGSGHAAHPSSRKARVRIATGDLAVMKRDNGLIWRWVNEARQASALPPGRRASKRVVTMMGGIHLA